MLVKSIINTQIVLVIILLNHNLQVITSMHSAQALDLYIYEQHFLSQTVMTWLT